MNQLMAAAALARRSFSASSTMKNCCYLHLFSTNNNTASFNYCCNSSSKSPFYSSYYYYNYVSSLSHCYFSTAAASTTPVVFTEDYFVSKYQFSPQIASKIVSASARMRNPQNPDLVLSFFKQTGFSNAHLDRIVRHHTKLLSLCPEKNVKPRFKIFHDLGLSAGEITQLIGRDPTILHRGSDSIIHSLDVYRRLLGSNDHVVKLIKRYANLLYTDPEKTILPNIHFLKECGIQITQINSLICTIPGLFMISPDNMRRCVQKVDEMGVERTSRMFIYAVEAVSKMSNETLELKLKSFQDLGFSEYDILRMFRSAPGVIAVSTRKIMEVKEVLLESGKYDMSCIIKSPVSLMCSVEKRLKPRLQVLKALERKGLIDKWPFLSTLCRLTNNSFFEKFVAPHINEVGKDFIAKTAASSIKAERETGLKPN